MILSAFERKVAWRYLSSTRREGFISFFAIFSFIGIALGVATLIIVTSVMNGFRENLLSAIVGMRPHIMVMKQELTPQDDAVKQIKKAQGVVGVYPTIEKQNILTFRGQAKGVIVQGIQVEDFKDRKKLTNSVNEGCIDDFKQNGILIGYKLAEEYGINLHDRLVLMTPEGTQTAFGHIPRQRSFEVVGIFNYGMRDYDKNFVFMPLDTAQDFYKTNQTIQFLGVFLDDITRTPIIMKALRDLLPEDYDLIDWKHQDQSIFHAVEVEKNVMFLILMLLVIIAGFNITSSLVMLVKDKTRSIGILKTLGATAKNIAKIFTSVGLFIGFVGTFLGFSLGLMVVIYIENIRQFLESLMDTELFSAEIYYLTKLPAVLKWSDVLLICLISMTLSIVASFFPALKASRLDPVEALKG